MGEALSFFARRIDLVLLSHPHQDHVAGLVDVLARHRVGAVVHAGIGYQNHAYDQLVADAGVEPLAELGLARAGAVFHLDAATRLEIIYPTEADAGLPLPEGDINNGSVVALLRYGGFTALLTGDAEAPIERLLLERGLIATIDVLKVGHHGSDTSTTPHLLAAARPGVAIISSGADNEYGHPHAVTLETLATVPNIATYRTDLDGDVEVITDGRAYTVRTDHGESGWRPVQAATGSIGPWRSPTSIPPGGSWPSTSFPTGSWCTPRACIAWRRRRPGWWPRPASRSTDGSWARRRSSMTSTSRASGAAAATMV
jgi:beta-lactamase superfamily II metal-dependent hydrolase